MNKIIKTFLIISIISLKGLSQDAKDDYALKNFQNFLAQANSGDIAKAYLVGYAYHWGIGVEKNMDKAIEWYEKSANDGNMDALSMMCGYYLTMKNDKLSHYWLTKAAYRGDPISQFMLGNKYAFKPDFKHDYPLAYMWLSASNQNKREFPEAVAAQSRKALNALINLMNSTQLEKGKALNIEMSMYFSRIEAQERIAAGFTPLGKKISEPNNNYKIEYGEKYVNLSPGLKSVLGVMDSTGNVNSLDGKKVWRDPELDQVAKLSGIPVSEILSDPVLNLLSKNIIKTILNIKEINKMNLPNGVTKSNEEFIRDSISQMIQRRKDLALVKRQSPVSHQ